MEEIDAGVMAISLERIPQLTVGEIMNGAASRLQEQIVEVANVIPQERLSPAQQLSAAHATGLVDPQLSVTAAETSVPQVVDTVSPLKDPAAPVCSKDHQERSTVRKRVKEST